MPFLRRVLVYLGRIFWRRDHRVVLVDDPDRMYQLFFDARAHLTLEFVVGGVGQYPVRLIGQEAADAVPPAVFPELLKALKLTRLE